MRRAHLFTTLIILALAPALLGPRPAEARRRWLGLRLGLGRPAKQEAPRGPAGTWLRAEGKPRAVALVLHGMNIRPSRMDAVARVLNGAHVDCYRGVLAGHDGDMAALKRVTRTSLLRDVSRAYDEAASRARRLGVPLYLVGFSLGALLPNDLAAHDERVRFDRMILFAPEFTPHKVANLLRPLRPFKKLVIPSSFPKGYSVHRGTPVSLYSSLLDSVRALRQKGLDHARVPTIVFADARDKLADTGALARTIQRQRLDVDGWKLFHIRGEGPTYRRGMGHLIIDQEAVGASQWQRMAATIRDFVRPDVEGP